MTDKRKQLNLKPSAELNQAITELAERLHISRQQVLREGVRLLHAREWPPRCVGYIEVARQGSPPLENECLACGQDIGWPYYVALMSDGNFHGFVCSECATKHKLPTSAVLRETHEKTYYTIYSQGDRRPNREPAQGTQE